MTGPRPGPSRPRDPGAQRGTGQPSQRAPGGGVTGRPPGGRDEEPVAPVLATGPLGRVIKSDSAALTPGDSYRLPGYSFGPGANALIIMSRVAFFDVRRTRLHDDGQRALLRWAAEHDLGQAGDDASADTAVAVGLVAARRARAAAGLRQQGMTVIRLRAVSEWRMAVGLGNKANAHEIGLSLHGTYGWPVVPGSSLKGMTAAYAIGAGADAGAVRQILGMPRHDLPAPARGRGKDATGGPAGGAARGTVRFLDAIPAGPPVKVTIDVLTPHVKPYYDATRPSPGPGQPGGLVPPAEYHNPVPVYFLAVSGAFAVDLYGPDADDVEQAAKWLAAAGDGLGAGGKTGAGYGFLSITSAEDE